MGSEASSRSRGADYLEHYGVKGMQWGVRRTKAQLARAGSAAKSKAKERKEGADTKIKAERKALGAKRRTLADGDIEKLTKRLESEKKLKNLVDSDVSPGKKFVNDVMSDSGKRVATTFVAGAATALVAKKFGDTVARGKLKK